MRIHTIFVISALLFSTHLIATAGEVIVTPLSSEESAYFMQNLSKIEVAPDFYEKTTLVFYDEQGGMLSEKQVSAPVKITFGSHSGSSLEDATVGTLRFYPNPSTDFITIDGLQHATHVRIYTRSGLLVLSTMDSQIDVSSLVPGVYVLQVGEQCFKIIIR